MTPARKIANMMQGRRLQLRHPGPRSFPTRGADMSTAQYVKEYEWRNRRYSCLSVADLAPEGGLS